MTMQQDLHRRNLQTAWALSAGWKPEHQEQLAALVVEELVNGDDALDHDAATCDCASCVAYMENLLADVETERRMEVERARR